MILGWYIHQTHHESYIPIRSPMKSPKVNLAGFTAVHLDDMGGAHVDVESPEVGGDDQDGMGKCEGVQKLRMIMDICGWNKDLMECVIQGI